MMLDPIVEEGREARKKHAEKFNRDLHSICKDLKEKEKKCGHPIKSLLGPFLRAMIVIVAVLFCLIGCSTSSRSTMELNKLAFAAGAVIGDNIALIASRQALSDNKLDLLKQSMGMLGVDEPTQIDVIQLLRQSGDHATARKFKEAMQKTNQAKDKLKAAIENKHNDQVAHMLTFGTSVMAAVDMAQTAEIALRHNPPNVSKILKEGLATPLAGMKLSAAKIRLPEEVNKEVDGAIKDFRLGEIDTEGVQAVCQRLTNILAYYGLMPFTKLEYRDPMVTIEQSQILTTSTNKQE